MVWFQLFPTFSCGAKICAKLEQGSWRHSYWKAFDPWIAVGRRVIEVQALLCDGTRVIRKEQWGSLEVMKSWRRRGRRWLEASWGAMGKRKSTGYGMREGSCPSVHEFYAKHSESLSLPCLQWDTRVGKSRTTVCASNGLCWYNVKRHWTSCVTAVPQSSWSFWMNCGRLKRNPCPGMRSH